MGDPLKKFVALVCGAIFGAIVSILILGIVMEAGRITCMKQYDRATCHQVLVPGEAEVTP